MGFLKKVLVRVARQSPAMIVAMLALFVALTGTAVATTSALIGSAQIRNNSITGLDVKNRSLRPIDFRGSVRGPRGLRGLTGATGAAGAAGATGAKGDKGDAGPGRGGHPSIPTERCSRVRRLVQPATTALHRSDGASSASRSRFSAGSRDGARHEDCVPRGYPFNRGAVEACDGIVLSADLPRSQPGQSRRSCSSKAGRSRRGRQTLNGKRQRSESVGRRSVRRSPQTRLAYANRRGDQFAKRARAHVAGDGGGDARALRRAQRDGCRDHLGPDYRQADQERFHHRSRRQEQVADTARFPRFGARPARLARSQALPARRVLRERPARAESRLGSRICPGQCRRNGRRGELEERRGCERHAPASRGVLLRRVGVRGPRGERGSGRLWPR